MLKKIPKNRPHIINADLVKYILFVQNFSMVLQLIIDFRLSYASQSKCFCDFCLINSGFLSIRHIPYERFPFFKCSSYSSSALWIPCTRKTANQRLHMMLSSTDRKILLLSILAFLRITRKRLYAKASNASNIYM